MSPEDRLQINCVEWFRIQYPCHIIYAPTNGVRVSIGQAMKMKRMGNQRAIPDLCIPHKSNGYGGLYIELKQPNRYPNPQQRQIMAQLQGEGYCCAVIKTLERFVEFVNNYMKGGE